MTSKKKSKKVPHEDTNEVTDDNAASENVYLRQEIARSPAYSTVYLSQDLNDRDIEYVVEEAVIKKQCRVLQLTRCKVTFTGASILANALNNTENILEELQLLDNRIGDDGVLHLAKVLSINENNLKVLDLTTNRISNVGAKYLAEMIQTNERLTALHIAGNEIGNQGIQMIINAIQYHNRTLEELDFCTNRSVDDDVVDDLIQLMKHSQTLKRLFLFNCNLSQNGKDKLMKMQKKIDNFWLMV
ncbi:hypothetical protein I4U23_010912 [Adineta vaga]|nr:hypothetical protein I4U23_010912 [Adineta vaga]